MPASSALHPASTRWRHHLLALPTIALAMAVVVPNPSGVERDTDEGLHLMMSWLYHQGYPFFDRILYDHFPLFDVMLSHWMGAFGFTIVAARAMVLVLAVLLLWLFYLLIAARHGVVTALVSTLLVCGSGELLLTAGSTLQALPWITFGLAALAVLRHFHHRDRQGAVLAASAALMAVAIQIKLFAVLMLPAMAVELLRHPSAPWRRLWQWCAALVIASLLLLYLTAPALLRPDGLISSYRYLVASHVGMDGFFRHNTLGYLLAGHSADFPLLLLAAIALCRGVRRRGVDDWFPLLWLLCDGIALMLIHPVWYHYYTMLSIPVVWLAAPAIHGLFRAPDGGHPFGAWLRQGVGVILWFVILTLPFRIENLSATWDHHHYTLDARLTTLLDSRARDTEWMVTDRPIYPFQARINVPPELAVTSLTLMKSGVQSGQSYLDAIDRYHPGLVLLARFHSLRVALAPSLTERGYRPIYHTRRATLYRLQSQAQ